MTLDSAALAIIAATSIIGFQLFAIWILELRAKQRSGKHAL